MYNLFMQERFEVNFERFFSLTEEQQRKIKELVFKESSVEDILFLTELFLRKNKRRCREER